ncbi:hypothetical protein MKX59_19560 [Paenibacillus sp. FSL R7-0340]|uniref:hypothetical protein n=1 Tax=Paenibacillus sp. FSL R7-0340 TaxID=2921684 RepID=UPI0030F8F125
MSGKGWISVHRKMLDNPVVCKDGDYMAVWMYLLLNATHTEYPALFSGKKVILQPGQLITGRKSISEKLNISESKVQRILKSFESEHQIEQQNGNKNRLVTVVSWSEYQESEQQNEQQLNNKRTTTEQQVNTNNNVITEQQNNENKKPPSPKNPKRIYSEDDRNFKLAKRFHELAYQNALEIGTDHLIESPNFQKWANTFRLMIEKQKLSEAEIGEVVKFALSDSFYRTIIFSPDNLRKQYQAILTKMRTQGGGGRGQRKASYAATTQTGGGYESPTEDLILGKSGSEEKSVSEELLQRIRST